MAAAPTVVTAHDPIIGSLSLTLNEGRAETHFEMLADIIGEQDARDYIRHLLTGALKDLDDLICLAAHSVEEGIDLTVDNPYLESTANSPQADADIFAVRIFEAGMDGSVYVASVSLDEIVGIILGTPAPSMMDFSEASPEMFGFGPAPADFSDEPRIDPVAQRRYEDLSSPEFELDATAFDPLAAEECIDSRR